MRRTVGGGLLHGWDGVVDEQVLYANYELLMGLYPSHTLRDVKQMTARERDYLKRMGLHKVDERAKAQEEAAQQAAQRPVEMVLPVVTPHAMLPMMRHR